MSASGTNSLIESVFRKGRRSGQRQPTGGLYEVYVVTHDGFYVAGGTRRYTNKRAAAANANAWLDSRRDVRAYVVTL